MLFAIMSFDKGNFVVGKDVFDKMEELVELYHRVEWRMICGNPVERSYDRFCKKHNGKKHILKDAIKDKYGNYRDDVIYEIVGGEQLKNVRNLGNLHIVVIFNRYVCWVYILQFFSYL